MLLKEKQRLQSDPRGHGHRILIVNTRGGQFGLLSVVKLAATGNRKLRERAGSGVHEAESSVQVGTDPA